LVGLEWELRLQAGGDRQRTLAQFCQRFPDLAEQLRRRQPPGFPEQPPEQEASDLPPAPTLREGSAPSSPAGEWPALPGYQILSELGKGGMGVVYLARQVHADRLVALKMIHPGILHQADSVARFRREAQAMAQLHHAHV